MKQTATDYFYDSVLKLFMQYHEEDVPTIDFSEAITEAYQRAKEIEKGQITDAYIYARVTPSTETYLDDGANKYYTSTFNS